VRWVFWTGGLLAIGALWWLFQAAGLEGSNTTALVGGTVLFLVGLLMTGLGWRSIKS
jgi:hypothetical protein